jgi:hypothetical protein
MTLPKVRVIEVRAVIAHPRDPLSDIIPLPGKGLATLQVVVPRGMYAPGHLAVYVEPGMLCPTWDPLFAHLLQGETGKYARTRIAWCSGELSYGMLFPAPSAYRLDTDPAGQGHITQEGDDLAALYGIVPCSTEAD